MVVVVYMYIIHSGCIPFWAVAIGHCNTCFELHREGPGPFGGNPFIVCPWARDNHRALFNGHFNIVWFSGSVAVVVE